MKILKYLCLILVVAMTVSCEKHEIEYKTTSIGDVAEFQLHYYAPVTAVAANNIVRVEVDNKLLSNDKAILYTYNSIPSGATGRFYTIDYQDSINIKLYKAGTLITDPPVLIYDKNCKLKKGKQNVFIHDLTKRPTVFENGFPYTPNVTANTDSISWVKFYNFLYETSGVPTSLRLQYYYIDEVSLALVPVGDPVYFGESTDWEPVKVYKDIFNSSGYSRVDYRIKVVDADGNILGDLMLRKTGTSNSIVAYSDYWTLYIGRRYHHIMSGLRTVSPGAAVRVFTAL